MKTGDLIMYAQRHPEYYDGLMASDWLGIIVDSKLDPDGKWFKVAWFWEIEEEGWHHAMSTNRWHSERDDSVQLFAEGR